METISLSKTTALALQNEQLMQDEIDRYTEMTSLILQTHTDHEMIALGDLLPTELKATLKKIENVSLIPNQSSDIHVSLHTDTLVKELSIFGRVMGSSPSPSQSTWSSKLVAKVNEVYGVKVETMTSKGERYPYGGLQVRAELRPKSHDGAVIPGEVEDHGDKQFGSHTSRARDHPSSLQHNLEPVQHRVHVRLHRSLEAARRVLPVQLRIRVSISAH
eukprot:Em0004g1082a